MTDKELRVILQELEGYRIEFKERLANIEATLKFLRQNLPLRYEITGRSRRREILQVPEAALREAVVNAVAHRDYFERGANVMVEIFDDRVEISNPGGLVKGLTPENFGKRSVLRNPNIASLLHRSGYVEKMGTGVSRMREILKQAKLPPPEFEFNSFFTVTFRRPVKRVPIPIGDIVLDAVHDAVREGVLDAVEDAVAESVRDTIHVTVGGTIDDPILQRLVILIIALFQGKEMKLGGIQEMLHVSTRTATRDVALLRGGGLVEFTGSLRKGYYSLTAKAKGAIRKGTTKR